MSERVNFIVTHKWSEIWILLSKNINGFTPKLYLWNPPSISIWTKLKMYAQFTVIFKRNEIFTPEISLTPKLLLTPKIQYAQNIIRPKYDTPKLQYAHLEYHLLYFSAMRCSHTGLHTMQFTYNPAKPESQEKIPF